MIIKSVVTVCTAAVMVATAAMPAQAAQARSTILRTPEVVRLSADHQYVTVRVTYRCTNNEQWVHYLRGLVTQSDEADPGVNYVYGYRNDSGGTRLATCTGARVTEKLQFLRDSYSGDLHPEWTLEPGPADFNFAIERRGAPGVGPGWYTYDSEIDVYDTVTVRVP